MQGVSLNTAPAGRNCAPWRQVCTSHLCQALLVSQACTCNAGVVFRIIGWGTGQPLLGAKTVAGMLMISTIVGKPVSAHSTILVGEQQTYDYNNGLPGNPATVSPSASSQMTAWMCSKAQVCKNDQLQLL